MLGRAFDRAASSHLESIACSAPSRNTRYSSTSAGTRSPNSFLGFEFLAGGEFLPEEIELPHRPGSNNESYPPMAPSSMWTRTPLRLFSTWERTDEVNFTAASTRPSRGFSESHPSASWNLTRKRVSPSRLHSGARLHALGMIGRRPWGLVRPAPATIDARIDGRSPEDTRQ